MKPYYEHGGVTIYLGDCLEVMATLPPASFDAVITDPPYGTTACAWDSPIPFAPMWAALKRLIKPRAPVVLFGSQPFTSALVMSNPGWFRYAWVWDKNRATGGANADNAPMRAHEDICIFGMTAPAYNPQMTGWSEEDIKRKRRHDFLVIADSPHEYTNYLSPGRGKQVSRGRHPDSIIRMPALGSIDPERTGHHTQKPLALLEYLVLTYTEVGGRVLDFTCGSGTTLRACKNLGRECVGIEQEERYCATAEQRLSQEVMGLV